jgi:hypothetical protein
VMNVQVESESFPLVAVYQYLMVLDYPCRLAILAGLKK